jgi:hypothetical protein
MYTEDHYISNKRITFFYDDSHQFFWILVDGKYSQLLEKTILDKICPIDIELYNYKWEINMDLHDIITNYLEYA